MKIKGNFNVVMEGIEISSLIQRTKKATEEQWNRNPLRQNRFEVAQEVVTILLKLSDLTHNNTKTFDEWDEWEGVVDPVIKQVSSQFKNPFVNKCMLANLRPGKKIPKHTDSAHPFSVSHRLHIPLVTNKDAIMTVGGEEKNMKPGVCYEVNNRLPHSVVNNGDTDRVHLLFDIYERTDEEQKVADGVL